MSKKDHRENGSFVKVLRIFHNERKDRPRLNSLERELCSIVISWTGGGSGRYNYQSAKELARLVGSSNKTVLNALHRLKALGLINWYTFPHGVGVKHLRWAPSQGQKLWESSKPIHEPTLEEIEKADEFTSVDVLISQVCEKPNTVGYDIWRACCDYCGISEKDKKKVETDGPPEALEIIKSEEVFESIDLPFTSPEFADAWQEWKQHRRSSGRPLKANAETIALDELKANAENEADAINAINSAIAGGFMALRPDIARTKSGGATNPVCPVNCWSWMQKRMEQEKRQPEDMEEIKSWMKEFREYHPDAPAWVVWNARAKQWNVPGVFAKATDAGITGRFATALDGYEAIRQTLDSDSNRSKFEELFRTGSITKEKRMF